MPCCSHDRHGQAKWRHGHGGTGAAPPRLQVMRNLLDTGPPANDAVTRMTRCAPFSNLHANGGSRPDLFGHVPLRDGHLSPKFRFETPPARPRLRELSVSIRARLASLEQRETSGA